MTKEYSRKLTTAERFPRRRQRLVVSGELHVPDELQPWEFELLLPFAVAALDEILRTPDQAPADVGDDNE